MSEKLKSHEADTGSVEKQPEKMPTFEEHMENDFPKLPEEQIKEIHRQDKKNMREWRRKQDIISARSELEQIYAAKERGDETVAIQKGYVEADGEYATNEFGRPIPKVNREFANDFTIHTKEQRLKEMEDTYAGGKVGWALYKLKKKLGIGQPKGKVGPRTDRVVLNDAPKPPEKSN